MVAQLAGTVKAPVPEYIVPVYVAGRAQAKESPAALLVIIVFSVVPVRAIVHDTVAPSHEYFKLSTALAVSEHFPAFMQLTSWTYEGGVVTSFEVTVQVVAPEH